MEKTSLKLVFLFSLTIISFCSYLVDSREMAKEEVNFLGAKCPEGKKKCNSLPLVSHIMETNRLCNEDSDCLKFCPPHCKPGACVCACEDGCVCTC